MGEVIGPVDFADWHVMLMLRGAVNYMNTNNEGGKFDIALAKERNYYRNMVRTLPRKAA